MIKKQEAGQRQNKNILDSQAFLFWLSPFGTQGCFGLWNLPIMHCSMKLFLLSPLLWIICKIFMSVC